MHAIAIIIAMQSEAQPIIEAMGLIPQSHPFHAAVPFRLFQGKLDRCRLDLLVSGTDPQLRVDNVATVPAALMAYMAIEKFAPELIINAGTAGGFGAKGCAIGEVYLGCDHISFHDRRIPIPGFREYGRGRYPAADTTVLAAELGLKTGAISSGNSLDMSVEDFREIQESGAIIKDMEAAAIAWVCQMLRVPLIAIKAITDLIDDPAPTEEQFLANLQLAVSSLQEKTVALLKYLVQQQTANTTIFQLKLQQDTEN